MKKVFSIKVRSRLLTTVGTASVFILAAAAGFGGQAVWGDDARAASIVKVASLSAPSQIDESARQQYLAARLAEQERRREVELQRQKALENAAQTSAVTREAGHTAQSTSQSDRLIIPKIGLNSPLTTVGMAGGAIDVHPSLPGRWNGSARPGSNGAVFVDGHNDGIFARLGALAVGDQIMITNGGATYTYTVVFTKVAPLESVNMAKALTVYGGAKQGLNLMTCAGSPVGNTYSHRLTVYAVLS
ncbi:class F sortase [Candidatus Saccharibacteria bacterium]|nr:class F sortase [Candidatus Saccharibacteria bacterium]